MASKFGIILDVLIEAFKNSVSEQDYCNIVKILREYTNSRENLEIEQDELKNRGYPLDYHPCDHMERIRFAMTFGKYNNTRINDLLLSIQ